MLTTLGLFGKGMVVVPNLDTLSYTDAVTALQNIGLLASVVSTPVTTQTSSLNEKIATQSIPAGTIVDYETVISISYYSYSAPAFTVFAFSPAPTFSVFAFSPAPTPPPTTGTVYMSYIYAGQVFQESYTVDENNFLVQNIGQAVSVYTSFLSGLGATSVTVSTSSMPAAPTIPGGGFTVFAFSPAPTFTVFAFSPAPTPCYADEIPSGSAYRSECCGTAIRLKVLNCSGQQVGTRYECVDSCGAPAFSVFAFTPAPAFSVFAFTPAGFSVFGFLTGFSVFSFAPTGGGGCLVYGTPILLADRTYKNVEDLVVGDELLSLSVSSIPDEENPTYLDSWTSNNLDDATFTTTAVTNIIKSTWEGYYLLNNKLKVTYEHTMLVKRDDLWKFTQMENVVVGDYVVDSEGDTVLVNSIQYINSPVETVSIDTEVKDLYFANDILVHNMYASK